MSQKEDSKKKEEKSDFSEKFLETRQILLSDEINSETAEKVVKQLLLLESISDKPIYLFINSPGGEVESGFAIYDAIRFINAPVYTIGWGLVASAGALIYLSVPKERRYSMPNGHYLIHQPLGGCEGTATEVEIHAVEIEKTKAKLNALIAEATGNDLETVKKDTERDHWLSAEESLDYGIVGKIITKRSEIAND